MCRTRKVIFRGQVSEICTFIRTWLILYWIRVRQDDFCSQNWEPWSRDRENSLRCKWKLKKFAIVYRLVVSFQHFLAHFCEYVSVFLAENIDIFSLKFTLPMISVVPILHSMQYRVLGFLKISIFIDKSVFCNSLVTELWFPEIMM